MHANRVNLACLDDLKATVTVILVITGSGKSCADPCVNVAVVGEESFERRVVEIGAVVDAGLFARSTAEDFRSPCIASLISQTALI